MVGVTLEASLPAQVTPVVYHGGGQQWPPLLLPPYTTPTTSHNAYYTALRMLPRVTHGYATSYVTSALVCPQRYMPPRARAPVLPPRTLLVSKGLLYDVEYSPRHHAVIQWGKLKRFCNPPAAPVCAFETPNSPLWGQPIGQRGRRVQCKTKGVTTWIMTSEHDYCEHARY